jgi:hypothetical protein
MRSGMVALAGLSPLLERGEFLSFVCVVFLHRVLKVAVYHGGVVSLSTSRQQNSSSDYVRVATNAMYVMTKSGTWFLDVSHFL